MKSSAKSLPAHPENGAEAAPDDGYLAEYDRRQQRQYNRLFIICWLIILITGLVTLFLVSGPRSWHSAAAIPGR